MTEGPATEPGVDPALWTPLEVRVCYGEVHRMGFAYYANYLRWFEMGRGQYLRVRGRPYREIEEQGLAMPVIEACVRYRRPARYDDLLEVRTAVAERATRDGARSGPVPGPLRGGASLESGAERATRDRARSGPVPGPLQGGASLESGAERATRDRARVRFEYRIVRTEDGELLAEGHTVHACTGKSGRPRRFPDDLLQLLHQPPVSAA